MNYAIQKSLITNIGNYDLDTKKIACLHEYTRRGYEIVIISNQKGLKNEKMQNDWIDKIKEIVKRVDLRIWIFASFDGDKYRKPCTGIWDEYIRGELKKSFYCGDAAGSQNDHSDTDLKFSKNVGIKFRLPEDMFNKEKDVIVPEIKYPLDFNIKCNNENYTL